MKPLVIMLVILFAGPGAFAGVADSKHNLSTSGPGSIKAEQETRVCAFCHVPHAAAAPRALWSKPMPVQQYIPYESSTLEQQLSQPDGASRLCLSCHDGTIALGRLRKNENARMRGTGAGGFLPPGRSNLGLDLRSSHPVSMKMPVVSAKLRRPLRETVKLDREDKVQCTSCHDPHEEYSDPAVGKFLTGSNAHSSICLACHTLRSWDSGPSSHQISNEIYGTEHGNHTNYRTVAEAGCASCHRQHGAAPGPRLLTASEENVCLNCHSGAVAKRDVANEFNRPFAHGVLSPFPSVHDAAEGPHHARFDLPERIASRPRHVECVDCHNPHASNPREASPPYITGALEDVWGIDRFGAKVDPARFEYEVCFKCHGDSANSPSAIGFGAETRVRRQVREPSLRVAFDPTGPSAHPVVGAVRDPGLPGLTFSSPNNQMGCTDCHGSDDDSPVPHGSNHEFMLRRPYAVDDFTMESPDAYALCYGCHDRQTLLSAASRFDHQGHVVRENAPCSTCHSAHGTGPRRGDPVGNAHLVNFDLNIVRPAQGVVGYVSNGIGSGTCTLTCHGERHDATAYPAFGP